MECDFIEVHFVASQHQCLSSSIVISMLFSPMHLHQRAQFATLVTPNEFVNKKVPSFLEQNHNIWTCAGCLYPLSSPGNRKSAALVALRHCNRVFSVCGSASLNRRS